METKGDNDYRPLKLVLTSLFAVLFLAGITSAAITVTIDIPAANTLKSGSVNIGVTTGPANTSSVVTYYKLNTTTSWMSLGMAANASNNMTWNYTWVTTSFADGNYTIAANATNATDSGSDTNLNIEVNNSYLYLSALAPSGIVGTTSLTLTVTTSEVAICYYNATGGVASSASGTFSTTGAGVTVHNQSIGGSWTVQQTYNISCTSYWTPGEIASSLTSFTPASSGGIVVPMWKRGGGTTVTNRQTSTVPLITTSEPATVTITKEVLAFTSIEISVKNTVNNLRLVIEKKDTGPAGLSGSVYRYVQITVDNLGLNLDNAVMSFSIPKTWFDSNSLDPATTKLYRYTGSEWEELTTESLGLTGDNYEFNATTTSFSVFAIAAQALPPAPTPVCTTGQTQACTTSENCSGTQPCTNGAWGACADTAGDNCPAEAPTTTAGPTDWTWLIIVVVVIIVLALAVFYTRGKKSYPIRSK